MCRISRKNRGKKRGAVAQNANFEYNGFGWTSSYKAHAHGVRLIFYLEGVVLHG
jgi:hypothetical protein